MTYEFRYRRAADEALDKLDAEPQLRAVAEAVDRLLVRMETDPFSHRLVTTSFMSDEYDGINATPVGVDDWYVLWKRGTEPRTLEVVLVHQIRLSTH